MIYTEEDGENEAGNFLPYDFCDRGVPVDSDFYPFCVEVGTCDYLKLWILVGIPFGIRKMQIWIVPRNRDVGSTIAMLVFQMLIGGMIGGGVLVWKLFLLLVFMVLQLYRGIKKLIK